MLLLCVYVYACMCTYIYIYIFYVYIQFAESRVLRPVLVRYFRGGGSSSSQRIGQTTSTMTTTFIQVIGSWRGVFANIHNRPARTNSVVYTYIAFSLSLSFSLSFSLSLSTLL
jgi:hypothetical protein